MSNSSNALAQAFTKDPKMLIFDEATSALDKKNEAEVNMLKAISPILAIDGMRKSLG